MLSACMLYVNRWCIYTAYMNKKSNSSRRQWCNLMPPELVAAVTEEAAREQRSVNAQLIVILRERYTAKPKAAKNR